MIHTTIDNLIQHEAISFSIDSSETLNASIDKVINSLDKTVELLALSGSAVFILTHKGQGFSVSEINALSTRSGSKKNLSCKDLTSQSFIDLNWFAVLDSMTYSRCWPPMQQQDTGTQYKSSHKIQSFLC